MTWRYLCWISLQNERNRWRIFSEEIGYFLTPLHCCGKTPWAAKQLLPWQRGAESLGCVQAASCSGFKGRGSVLVLMYPCSFPLVTAFTQQIIVALTPFLRAFYRHHFVFAIALWNCEYFMQRSALQCCILLPSCEWHEGRGALALVVLLRRWIFGLVQLSNVLAPGKRRSAKTIGVYYQQWMLLGMKGGQAGKNIMRKCWNSTERHRRGRVALWIWPTLHFSCLRLLSASHRTLTRHLKYIPALFLLSSYKL